MKNIGSLKILVAEDDNVARDILKQCLTDASYEVCEAQTGEQAWQLIQSEPDLALAVLDVNMPVMSGLQVARKIQSKIPFIMLTVDNREDTIHECIRVGAFNYLLKPIDPTKFIPMVEAALARGIDYHNVCRALESTPVIHAAAGILMEKLSVSYEVALEYVRNYASHRRVKATTVANEIIDAQQTINRLVSWTTERKP